MPYSTACNTPLSNFEAGLDYRDVSDPAIMVRQRLRNCDAALLFDASADVARLRCAQVAFPVIGDADGASLVRVLRWRAHARTHVQVRALTDHTCF